MQETEIFSEISEKTGGTRKITGEENKPSRRERKREMNY